MQKRTDQILEAENAEYDLIMDQLSAYLSQFDDESVDGYVDSVLGGFTSDNELLEFLENFSAEAIQERLVLEVQTRLEAGEVVDEAWVNEWAKQQLDEIQRVYNIIRSRINEAVQDNN